MRNSTIKSWFSNPIIKKPSILMLSLSKKEFKYGCGKSNEGKSNESLGPIENTSRGEDPKFPVRNIKNFLSDLLSKILFPVRNIKNFLSDLLSKITRNLPFLITRNFHNLIIRNFHFVIIRNLHFGRFLLRKLRKGFLSFFLLFFIRNLLFFHFLLSNLIFVIRGLIRILIFLRLDALFLFHFLLNNLLSFFFNFLFLLTSYRKSLSKKDENQESDENQDLFFFRNRLLALIFFVHFLLQKSTFLVLELFFLLDNYLFCLRQEQEDEERWVDRLSYCLVSLSSLIDRLTSYRKSLSQKD